MRRDPKTGANLLVASGAILVLSGLVAIALAATIKLLPNDTAYLGLSIAELDRFAGGRIVDFMAHDRLAMAGTFIAIGILYVWLASVPLRRGEAWAWWALAVSGLIGFASFLSYLGYGYLDWIHGLATICLLAIFLTGMVLSRRGLRAPSGIAAMRPPVADLLRGWSRPLKPSRIDLGRLGLLTMALGLIGSGATIVVLGVSGVFVPQDLDFIGLSAAQIRAIDPDLVPIIAHDRAEFGGGLLCIGVILVFVAIYGLKRREPALWWALAGALGANSAGAIISHPAIGYTTFFHLLPVYGALAMTVVLIWLLRGPLADAGTPGVAG